MEIQFFLRQKITTCSPVLVSQSVGNYKNIKTCRQCKSLVEQTEFFFFFISLFSGVARPMWVTVSSSSLLSSCLSSLSSSLSRTRHPPPFPSPLSCRAAAIFVLKRAGFWNQSCNGSEKSSPTFSMDHQDHPFASLKASQMKYCPSRVAIHVSWPQDNDLSYLGLSAGLSGLPFCGSSVRPCECRKKPGPWWLSRLIQQ